MNMDPTIYICGVYSIENTKIIHVFRKLRDAQKWNDEVSVHLKEIQASRNVKKYIKENDSSITGLCLPVDEEYISAFIVESGITESYKYPFTKNTKHLQS